MGILDAFRRAAEAGLFVLPRCVDCGVWNWPSREVCSRCLGTFMGWERISGRGEVVASARVERPDVRPGKPSTPFTIVLVALDEGCQFVTPWCTTGAPAARCKMVWRGENGTWWPWVEPDDEHSPVRHSVTVGS